MSHEGLTLVTRVLLVSSLIIVAAIFRGLVGPSRKRGRIMLAGALGGISLGVLVASVISPWLKADASVVCACLGMVLGWGVSWSVARQIPREAN
jgi:drug/metabolite transporter (DMT)-like permease